MSTLYLVGVTNLQNDPGGFANTDTALAPIRAYLHQCGISGRWSYTQKGIAHRIQRYRKYGKFLLLTKEQADLAVANNRVNYYDPRCSSYTRFPNADILCTFEEYRREIQALKTDPHHIPLQIQLEKLKDILANMVDKFDNALVLKLVAEACRNLNLSV